MKVIGMLGGMSWESTASYYAALNEGVKQRLGGLHSAKIVLYSVDFSEIETLQHRGDWAATGELLAQGAQAIERAGADFLIMCTNTMHKVAPVIQAAIGIPMLHIADATAEALKRDGIRRVGLLGTRFTMEQPFYRERLETHGIEVAVPEEEARATIHEVIYSELCLGVIKQESKQQFLKVMESLRARGSEAIILGCTEIALLVQQMDTDIPLYDTAAIHAGQAVAHALGEA
ncbi:MAG: aspartate/glutamate racemase family protein [Candidatus Hydrogenedentota bacterium]